MEVEKKIEFYKKRSVGEVLSASADFLIQNWKVMYKNILIIGGPLACLQGIFQHNYSSLTLNLSMIQGGFSASFLVNIILFIVISLLMGIFLYSITATFINQYGEGKLTKDTKWSDLKDGVYAYAGKIFLVFLFMFLVIAVVAVLISVLMGIIAAGINIISPIIISVIFILIAFGLLIPFAPGLSLIAFPALYQDKAAWISFTSSISLGFRHWGSTFLVLLVSIVITAVFSFIMAGAYQLCVLFGLLLPLGFVGTIISYVLAIVASFASLFSVPVIVTFLSFQYFNIVEEEDGISVQSGIDEFDNL